MEKILTPCVKYKRKSDPNKDWFAVAPDHAGCYNVLSFLEIYDRYDEVEGFQTTEGRFVDRREAYQLAKNAGQLINEDPNKVLKSYNIK